MDPEQLGRTIASAQSGSAEAYQALLEAYGPRLYGYFLRATRSRHDAEDLLGELTLRLVRRLRSYDHRGRFEPWLFRIAANLVRDRIRRRTSAPRAASLSAGDDSGLALAEAVAAADEAPDAGAVAQETSEQLQRALERLDDPTRQAILLRHFGEMSFREIASLLGCPLGTVLSRVHRGLRNLREHMGVQHELE